MWGVATLIRRAVLIGLLLIAITFLIVVLRVATIALFPPPSVGLAAVSVGISEALVEAIVLLVAGVVVWRVWRIIRPTSHAQSS